MYLINGLATRLAILGGPVERAPGTVSSGLERRMEASNRKLSYRI